MSQSIKDPYENSSIKRLKEKNTLKKQRMAIALMAIALVLLLVLFFVVDYLVDIYVYVDFDNKKYYIKKIDGVYALLDEDGALCNTVYDGLYQTDFGTELKVNKESGEYQVYAIPEVSGTEVVYTGTERILMYPALTYDISSTKDKSRVIKSIEIHNMEGSYTFIRDEDNSFTIKDFEGVPYDQTSFALLATTCGHTLVSKRIEDPKMLPDGSVDLAEYGLVGEIREKIQLDENGNEIKTKYEYEPGYFIITSMTGVSHKVYIGDEIVTGEGYYARVDGRDTVYILGGNELYGTTAYSNLLLGRVENILTPTIVYPMDSSNYFNVENFIIYDKIDYDAIYKALAEKYGNDSSSDEFFADYEKLFEEYSHKVCNISYVDIEDRQGTLNQYLPYKSHLEYADGYYLNSKTVNLVLNSFVETSFKGIEVLAPTKAQLDEYGINRAPYVISFMYKTVNSSGETQYAVNYVQVSQKSSDGVYYAYSPSFNMIVAIEGTSFAFLEYAEKEWYDTAYIQMNISYVKDIIIEAPGLKVDLSIDDSASKYMSYTQKSGSEFTINGKKYKITKDESGKYVLLRDYLPISPTYRGDYLVTPAVYSKGVAESEKYLLGESVQTDLNGDGNNDAILHYLYNVAYNGEEFRLAAQVIYTDLEGNRIAKDQAVWGESASATDFFITDSGYIYFTSEYSSLGYKLTDIYESKNRGVWGHGNIFPTAQGKYILVNSKTGEWSRVGDASNGIYFIDRAESRMAQRAVTIPALYKENGQIKRYGETYYPLTSKKIQYDDESGKIVAYNKAKKTWENITYADCTIGQWESGAYYFLDGGVIVVVNEESGDWGEVTVLSQSTYVADILMNGDVMDYYLTNSSGKSISAMENFQELYKAMLLASIEGMCTLDEQEKNNLIKLDSFSLEDANNPCQLKITVLCEDFAGNQKNMVYRFYRYSERRAYLTIEPLETDNLSESDSEKGYGNFYVLTSFVDKIIEDVTRLINEQEIYAQSKY